MKTAKPLHGGHWKGLGLSQALALAYLLGCVGWMLREVEILFANDRVAAALSIEQGIGRVLLPPLARFGAALILVHALIGMLAFAAARLTESAFADRIVASRRWLIAGWFVLFVGIAMAANTTWYPASIFAGESSWWRTELFGLYPVRWVLVCVSLFIAWLAVRVAASVRLMGLVPILATTVTLAVLATVFVSSRFPDASAPTDAAQSPHIIVIGIDSLRNDLAVPRRGAAETPNIQYFLARARRFNDAVSPLARTYGAWMTILTGRHPVTTNARVNLMSRRLVREGETLADVLRMRGYRTFYATDETRFANFDRSFGFDALITPPTGAVDFVLGYAGDLPLVNLAVATGSGGRLFPSNHANRAASVTYRPGHFVDRLENEIEVEGPTFLAIHLTLPHWPYSWAGMARPSVPEAYRDTYGRAVGEVDRQFRDVMRVLWKKRLLDNAIVVLLSDHGEALGDNSDSLLRKTGTSREIWDSLWGHGTSVMSPNQYRVLLAIRSFGSARLPGPQRDYGWPVSLEDVRPTLEEYATGLAPTGVDGVSLIPYMADPARAEALASRIRFTETDFNTPDTLAGRYEELRIIDQAAVYYELDRKSGWVQFRESRLPALLSRKQRAAFTSSTILAAIPEPPGRGPRYLLADLDESQLKTLEGPPSAVLDPEAHRLWDALMARFPGELPPASDLP